jgi:hypothetical protein
MKVILIAIVMIGVLGILFPDADWTFIVPFSIVVAIIFGSD